MLQIFMREGTTEYAPMINFTVTLQAYLPLGTPNKVGSPDFPLPLSFIYGEDDWVHHLEEDVSWKIMETNKFYKEGSTEQGLGVSRVYKLPTSDHNMHMDNPTALANTIINDVFNAGLDIPPNPKAKLMLESEKLSAEEDEGEFKCFF